jgi:hypothetical protein
MPERIFKYHDTAELIAGVKELGQLLASGVGATNMLKNSTTGFLKQTGPVTQHQLRNYFMLGRYEIWLRGQGTDGVAADPTCADLEATDPRLEKVMKLTTVYA